MCTFRIRSNWDVINGGALEDLIISSSSDEKNSSVEKAITEFGRYLTKGLNDSIESKPELEISASNAIKQIDVLSDGKLIEVFGQYDEYLFTTSSEFVDDILPHSVYHSKIVLQGLPQCKLKFSRIKNTEKLWICAIQITTEELQCKDNQLFNFENVEKLLNGSSQQTLDRAIRFRELFKSYSKNSPSAGNLEILASLLRAHNIEDGMKSFTYKRLKAPISSSSPESQIQNQSSENLVSAMGCFKQDNLSPNDVESLKQYIDKQVCNAKEEIMHHISFKLNELKEDYNCKLEKIICMLQK